MTKERSRLREKVSCSLSLGQTSVKEGMGSWLWMNGAQVLTCLSLCIEWVGNYLAFHSHSDSLCRACKGQTWLFSTFQMVSHILRPDYHAFFRHRTTDISTELLTFAATIQSHFPKWHNCPFHETTFSCLLPGAPLSHWLLLAAVLLNLGVLVPGSGLACRWCCQPQDRKS